MADPQKALQTQLANIQTKTGRSLDELRAAVAASGKTKHGEVRTWLKETFGLGHGDANTLAHIARESAAGPAPAAAGAAGGGAGDVLDEIYAGPKAHLRAVHEAVMAVVNGLGEHEVAPKKGYVSLRRKKQFAMLGPKARDRVELGINLKPGAGEADVASERVVAQRPGGMCHYIVMLRTVEDVDDEVVAALTRAFTAAG